MSRAWNIFLDGDYGGFLDGPDTADAALAAAVNDIDTFYFGPFLGVKSCSVRVECTDNGELAETMTEIRSCFPEQN